MILSSMNATSKWQGKRHVCTQVPRFSNFLTLRFLSRRSTSSPKFLGKVDGSRAAFHEKLLKVVSALSGYDSVEDFIVQERLCDKSTDQNCRKENFDLSLVSARFPCISVGDSSLIELYDEVKWKNNRLSLLMQESCTSHLSASAIRNWGDAAKEISADEISDASQFLMPQLPNINSSYEQCFSTLLNDSVTSHADGGVELDKLNANEYSVTEESKSANNNVCVESVLDASVKCIPQTTFRQCHQLEEGGFHTVRKLLHHFPRTYADLQTAPTEINDGDYLIFVGKVSSSRAIKISSSLSFLEIVVNVELVNDLEMCKKNINLHLKKFFRGVRFTYQPFLRSIQSKYELGAHVYITGKVKKMLHEDHYEIREYNIGVLEEDLNGQVENLLYPIYPSKAGMKPSFLKDIITRALKVLSKDIDPIPNNILQELNLPNLYDAYIGIHSPKDYLKLIWHVGD
ncbi:hypothetical protein HPP92_000274 [Vanilla planifolia]|uniref:Uncharacterized protein n=1 Tax=Vanilla planifolia TaxID=51239 RepID=A0A835RRT3_VANPL|nr:hypothetical protein HPP92_000274 [Vanilla planifolia]